MFGGVPELEISRSRKWAAGLDLLTAEKVYFGVGKDTQKAFSLAGRKAIDVPGHNLPAVSSSLPIEVGFGMPRIGSIKIPAANIQCLPLPNLSRAGIAVSSLQRFSRGVAIITWPEANEEGCLFRGFEFYRRHFLVMLGDQICYSFATQFWLYYSYPTYRTALN